MGLEKLAVKGPRKEAIPLKGPYGNQGFPSLQERAASMGSSLALPWTAPHALWMPENVPWWLLSPEADSPCGPLSRPGQAEGEQQWWDPEGSPFTGNAQCVSIVGGPCEVTGSSRHTGHARQLPFNATMSSLISWYLWGEGSQGTGKVAYKCLTKDLNREWEHTFSPSIDKAFHIKGGLYPQRELHDNAGLVRTSAPWEMPTSLA
ncbi:uncharacterized protein LOC125097507 [Lutra lutra]|uniref:uncharacterized protein LOC125097507 n=1 Tax=Lutra lutra TaxID=9657 RepID=UPI001FD09E72|nr:uncharacterized protein LOC125097507 [Lutra lutra]